MSKPIVKVIMPPDLLEKLRTQARQENRSLSNLIVTLLRRVAVQQ